MASTVPPKSQPRPVRSKGRRPEAARDCAVAVLVTRRGLKLADLIRSVGLEPASRSVMRGLLRILASGEQLLEDTAALPPEAMVVAAWKTGGYPGDTGALISTVIPHLRRLRGVTLEETELRARLVRLLLAPRPLT